MKKRNFKNALKVTGVIILAGVVLSSCDKRSRFEDDETGAEQVRAQMIDFDFMAEEIYAANTCELNLNEIVASGALITESSQEFPKTVTFDYGSGSTDEWGRTKTGKIIVYVTGDMSIEGSHSELSFENFSVNEIAIEGTRICENTGLNAQGNIEVSIESDITSSRGDRTRTHSFVHTREWISGAETCTIEDDEFLISGSGNMTTCGGRSASHTITESIHVKMRHCTYPTKGKIDIGTEKRGVYVDFGDGDCDQFADVTVKRKNKSHQINLETREIVK